MYSYRIGQGIVDAVSKEAPKETPEEAPKEAPRRMGLILVGMKVRRKDMVSVEQ